MKRDKNAAKASEIIADLQELIRKYGDLDCVTDDYGYYSCSSVVYVQSAGESGRPLGPYSLKDAVFLFQ
jgi:hypothetical protein